MYTKRRCTKKWWTKTLIINVCFLFFSVSQNQSSYSILQNNIAQSIKNQKRAFLGSLSFNSHTIVH